MDVMPSLPSLLLIEDERNIATTLAEALKNCYDVEIAGTGRLGFHKLEQKDFELIVLDLNLPDISGLAVCQQLRDRGVATPILILTGEAGVLSKIKLLDAGANDYLTKPFSLGELKARLRALGRLKNRTLPAQSGQLKAGGLVLDRARHGVSRDGQDIKLRRKEFSLLECLMENAGSVVSRAALGRFAWNGDERPWTNAVDVHIKHLRDKVDRPFGSNLIKTVHGIGYKLEETAKVTAP